MKIEIKENGWESFAENEEAQIELPEESGYYIFRDDFRETAKLVYVTAYPTSEITKEKTNNKWWREAKWKEVGGAPFCPTSYKVVAKSKQLEASAGNWEFKRKE